MKTQLLVTVKDASLMTKSKSSLLWFVEIFKKSKINVYFDSIDSEPIVLTARPEPYELPLSPGTHTVYFEDPKNVARAQLSKLGKNLTLGALGAGFGLAAGGALGAVVGAHVATDKKQVAVQENVLLCTLVDGDELNVTVKPCSKKVKVEVGN